MKKLLVVLALTALLAPAITAAEASRWRWTESYAEDMVLKKVRLPCKRVRPAKRCRVKAAREAVARYEKQLAYCKDLVYRDPVRGKRCAMALIEAGFVPYDNLAHVRKGFPVETAYCVGVGTPDSSGYRFPQFRCKISVVDDDYARQAKTVYGRIAVYATGRTTFRWKLIP